MQITTQELATLNLYCTSALHTARLLGQMVRRARDPQLRLEMTRRAADALRHAELWADTIRAVGGRPQATAPSYQVRYEPFAGRPDTLLQVLALMESFERRLVRQMLRHFHRAGTHPTVRATLRRMLEEELRPDWAARWLSAQADAEPMRVREVQQRYAAADALLPDSFEAAGEQREAA